MSDDQVQQDYQCPDCKKPLNAVRQTGARMYNDEQFDAMKAGDYYCETCPGNNRGKSDLKYWWKRELVEKEKSKGEK